MGKYFDILVSFVPTIRYYYSTIMVYFYVNYLKESQKKIESGEEDMNVSYIKK